MIRRLVVVVCSIVLVLALGTLAHHDVLSFRWADLLDPYVVKAMWSWLDRVRMPRSGWLISACLLALTAQGLAFVRALRRYGRWRAVQQAMVRGERGSLERSPGPKLQIVLGAAWFLIPLAAAFSVAEARALVLRRFLRHAFLPGLRHPSVSDLMNGQLAAIGIATLAALLAALVGGLAWSLELSMGLCTRGLKAAERMAPTDAPAAVAQAASPGPGPARTAALIYSWIGLAALPFVVGVWAFLWRLYAGQESLSRLASSRTAMMLGVLARARHSLQTAAWVQLAGTILAIVITLGLLTRWRRRWPRVIAWSGPATWGRTLLWSSLCLATAALCLNLAHPLRAENRTPWPPERLFVRCGTAPGDVPEGPDTLEPAPLLQVWKRGLSVRGSRGDTLETVGNLIAERRNFQRLHPTETFPDRVLIDCYGDQTAERLQEALSAIARAAYAEVQFCVTTGEILHRPTLGAITRWKTTAARARIGDGTTTLPSGAIRAWPTTTCHEMRRRIVELRRAGHEVVLAAPEKTEAERKATELRAKDAAARQEAASKVARRSKPPACGANQMGIPSATFAMGSETGAADEKPMHQVTLSAYCIDRTEVTVAAYRTCFQAGTCNLPKNIALPCTWSLRGMDQHPMSCVDWKEARTFCSWMGGRLPTEAEWEYAARTRGGRLAMTGELWEWTIDDYTDYGPEPVTNPKGTLVDASRRVARGGGRGEAPQTRVDVSVREKFNPGRSQPDLGFRCARGHFQIPTEWHPSDWSTAIPL